MIEVEKKFILTKDQEEKLTEGADFLGENVNIDLGYDDADFSLTTKDIWLRRRNGKFELKIPLNATRESRISDQYEEIDDEDAILKYFGAKNASLEDFLQEKKYQSLFTIVTTRRKYKKGGFNIDLDQMDFGYNVAEIEKMIENKEDIQKTTNEIILFAKDHGINTTQNIYGKAIEYFRRHSPKHFQALVTAKIVWPI